MIYFTVLLHLNLKIFLFSHSIPFFIRSIYTLILNFTFQFYQFHDEKTGNNILVIFTNLRK